MAAATKAQSRKIPQSKCITKIFSSMTKVHEVNRQHDHQLNIRVEELRQNQHMENVRRYSDIRLLQRTLSEMRMEKSRLTHTFMPEEIDNDDVAPVMSWRKIQLKRFQHQPRIKHRRKSTVTKEVEAVPEKAEFNAKRKFRSAIMAVCLSKALAAPDKKSEDGAETGDAKCDKAEKDKVNLADKRNSDSTEKEMVDTSDDLQKDMKQTREKNVGFITSRPKLTQQPNERNIGLITFRPKETTIKEETAPPKKDKAETKKEQPRPETTDTKRLSRVLDVLRNSPKGTTRSSWTESSVKRGNVVPTFGQLHPARRPSFSRRYGDPRPRRPSTTDSNYDFVMEKDGTVRRLSRPSVKASPTIKSSNAESSTGPRSQSSTNPGSRTDTNNSCKVYSTGPSRLHGLDDPSTNKNSAFSSLLLKKRREMAKRDREIMDRLRRFLDSSLP